MEKVNQTLKIKPSPYRVVLFGARQEVTNRAALRDAQEIAQFLAEEKHVLVNGGSRTGLMGYTAKLCHERGGVVHGIGLHKYEPNPHPHLTHWEGYNTHWERQRRLFELGDIYVALPGGIGTLHEVLEAHILQETGESTKPLILVGSFASKYRLILNFIERHGLLRKQREGTILYAKNGKEAVALIKKQFTRMKREGYRSSVDYPTLAPEEIFRHMKQNQNPHYVCIEGIKMKVLPDVFPSNRFRSSLLMAQKVKKMSRGKRVADIACGLGTMGIIAAKNGAEQVVQTDINLQAVCNAKENARELDVARKVFTYHGNIFDPLKQYRGYFDLIFFNPPFHLSSDTLADRLSPSLYTPRDKGALDKFLKDARKYLAKGGKIILGFSNKDLRAVRYLERLLKTYGYTVSLERHNEDSTADNRIYSLS